MAQVFHFGPYYWTSFPGGLPPGAQHSRSWAQTQDSHGPVWLPRPTESRRGSTLPQGKHADSP